MSRRVFGRKRCARWMRQMVLEKSDIWSMRHRDALYYRAIAYDAIEVLEASLLLWNNVFRDS